MRTKRNTKQARLKLEAQGNWSTEVQLNQLRKNGDYGELGNLFFHAFMILPKHSDIRKYYKKVWESMSDDEQNMCEG